MGYYAVLMRGGGVAGYILKKCWMVSSYFSLQINIQAWNLPDILLSSLRKTVKLHNYQNLKP